MNTIPKGLPDSPLEEDCSELIVHGPDGQNIRFDDMKQLEAWEAMLHQEWDLYTEDHPCNFMYFAANNIDQAEPCENIAQPGSEYCIEHVGSES